MKKAFKRNPTLEYIFKMRYLFVLVGIFSVYSGFIYNDFLSIMPNFFSTCFTGLNDKGTEYTKSASCVYPFGFDWRWSESSNSVEYFNSFKMKFAVIAGVIHMTLGIMMKGVNCIHFWNITDFFFDFIPQLIFFVSIFGYMVFAIIIKWLTDWKDLQVSKPPEIISLMINFVSSISVPLWQDAEQQLYIQQALAIIAVSCIPIMLIVKPLFVYLQQNSKKTLKEPVIIDTKNTERKFTNHSTTV